jgi:hypothetical protein
MGSIPKNVEIPLGDVSFKKASNGYKTLERKEVSFKNLGIYSVATTIDEGESYVKNKDLDFVVLKGFLLDEKGVQIVRDGKPVYIDLKFKDNSVKGGQKFDLDTFSYIQEIAFEVMSNNKLYVLDVPTFYTKTEKTLENGDKAVYNNYHINPRTFEDPRFKKIRLLDKINPTQSKQGPSN